jgi:hypothetical protein
MFSGGFTVVAGGEAASLPIAMLGVSLPEVFERRAGLSREGEIPSRRRGTSSSKTGASSQSDGGGQWEPYIAIRIITDENKTD